MLPANAADHGQAGGHLVAPASNALASPGHPILDDDDLLLLVFKGAGRVAHMRGWARVCSRWRRAWRALLSKVDTLNLPASAPTDSLAAHVLRARSLVDALRSGTLANVRKLKVACEMSSSELSSTTSLNVNELLRGTATSALVRHARKLPQPALIVLGMMVEADAQLLTLEVAGRTVRVHAPLQASQNSRRFVIDSNPGSFDDVTGAIVVPLLLDTSDLTGKFDRAPFAIALLSEMLKLSTSLRYLELMSNGLGDAAALALADMLKVNTSLNELNINSNEIGDVGAIGLGKALEVNKTLEGLWFGENPIGNAGAIGLAEGLKVNTALKQLYLFNNNFGNSSKRAIRTAWTSKPGRYDDESVLSVR